MGRKGVSKRKRAKEKAAPVSGNTAAASGHKSENQPDLVIEKDKASSKDNKKR